MELVIKFEDRYSKEFLNKVKNGDRVTIKGCYSSEGGEDNKADITLNWDDELDRSMTNFIPLSPLEDEMVEGVTEELWDKLRPKELDNESKVTCKLIIFDCSEGGSVNWDPTNEDWLKLIKDGK